MSQTTPMARTCAALLAILMTLLFADAAEASASPALARPAPTARFAVSCGDLGPCLVFSRGETEGMASGDVSTVVGIVAPACGLAGPFAVLCGFALADVGPVMQIQSKRARKQGKCAALQFEAIDILTGGHQGSVKPTVSRCRT